MRHLIDSCDRYIPFCLIVIFTVVSLCVCFNVFYLICHNNNNNNAEVEKRRKCGAGYLARRASFTPLCFSDFFVFF